MAAGIGVDMLEIERMERLIQRRPSVLTRVFTDEERAYCDARARPAEHYAARWAAREAVVKALGTGFAGGISFKDVSVVNGENGRPRAVLAGRALELAREQGVVEVAISISHTRDVAVANAVMVTEAVRPKPEVRVDAEREMLASFKQARVVIDELERQQQALLDDADETDDADEAAEEQLKLDVERAAAPMPSSEAELRTQSAPDAALESTPTVASTTEHAAELATPNNEYKTKAVEGENLATVENTRDAEA